MRAFVVLLFASLFACLPASPVPIQNPAAVMLVNQAVAAAVGRNPISDITLAGTVTYTAGSDIETGTATLEATARDESLVTLSLPGGERQWIRQGPAGVWTGPEGQPGQVHAMATHNCWVDAAWFFPAFSLEGALSNPAAGLSSSGAGSWQGVSVQQAQWSGAPPSGQTAEINAAIQQLSATAISLDASSLLPLALDFNLHPDNDAGQNLPVEIRFSDYRLVSGVHVPFHIQKLVQGSLLLDITVTNVTVNTGLADSVFTLPAATGAQP